MVPTNSGDLEHVPSLSVNSKMFENANDGGVSEQTNENGHQQKTKSRYVFSRRATNKGEKPQAAQPAQIYGAAAAVHQ